MKINQSSTKRGFQRFALSCNFTGLGKVTPENVKVRLVSNVKFSFIEKRIVNFQNVFKGVVQYFSVQLYFTNFPLCTYYSNI